MLSMESKPDGRVWQDLWVKCLIMVCPVVYGVPTRSFVIRLRRD
jgi:hypothetical protein